MQNKHADALKKAFSKEVLSRVESHRKYLDWLKKDLIIVNIMTSNHKDMNKEQVKEVAENHNESCFKINYVFGVINSEIMYDEHYICWIVYTVDAF